MEKMGHDHHHHHHHDTGNIKLAFFLNLSFTIIEVVGGIMTNSMAILSDALHDLGDSFSIGLAWFLQKFSKKESTNSYSYGYRRFSLLGAIINSVILIVGSVFIILETIPRLTDPQTPDTRGMMLLAILGVVVNGAAVFKLKKGVSINEEVISLHLLEDVLGWVAVLAGAIMMHYFNVPIIDPILSLGIAGFILFNVWKSIHKVTHVIMQGVPTNVDLDKINKYLKEIENVVNVHDLHVWSMDGEYNILTAHLVMQQDLPMDGISDKKKNIREGLHSLGIEHATIEFELEEEECVFQNCK